MSAELKPGYLCPPGYKQTEVGVIPEDWEVTNLGAIAALDVGYAFRSIWFQKHDGVPLLRGENVGYGRPDWSDTRRLAEEHAGSFGEYRLRPGDVVIGMDRTFTKSGTKISVLQDADCPCLLVQRVGRFVPRNCDGHFLWAILSSARFRQSLLAEQKGMDIPHLSRVEILSPVVPLPPSRAEQEAIAEALGDADALIESLEHLIAKKRHLKQAAMQQLLTGKKRLPGFTGKWQVKTFDDIFDIAAGGDVDPGRTTSYKDLIHCHPIYSNALTDKGLYGYCSYADHQAGSITVTARGTIGFANFRDHEFTAIGRVLVLHPKRESDGRFFAEVMNNCIKFAIESTGVPQLTAPQISIYSLPVPTFLEQTAIAAILSDMDAEIAALEAKLAKSHQIKQGMMHNLLTGRIRLI